MSGQHVKQVYSTADGVSPSLRRMCMNYSYQNINTPEVSVATRKAEIVVNQAEKMRLKMVPVSEVPVTNLRNKDVGLER